MPGIRFQIPFSRNKNQVSRRVWLSTDAHLATDIDAAVVISPRGAAVKKPASLFIQPMVPDTK